jgi:fructoselysine-6-P-deglycase FrlB-like protein
VSPFEKDIADQPAELRRLADAATPPELAQLAAASYDRIVLTGMKSSHFAALPSGAGSSQLDFPPGGWTAANCSTPQT